jgi:hypothetical protein
MVLFVREPRTNNTIFSYLPHFSVKMETAMRFLFSLILLSLLLLPGCTAPVVPPESGLTPAGAATTQPAVVSASPTPEPSATPQPGKVVLVAPDRPAAQPVEAALTELSSAAGLTLEVVSDLQPGAAGADTRVVVLMSAPANLTELLAAAPQAQFVVVSGADLPPAGNQTVIRTRPENQAFLGGFISVLLSTDWRAAGLLAGDGPLGAGIQDAFTNGSRYFCGMCGPGWPLGVYYPQVTLLPGASDGPSWQAAAQGMYDNFVAEVFYLSSEAARPEVFAFLNGNDQYGKPLAVVGTTPPPDELRGQWAASVGFDISAALNQAWPDLISGKGGAVLEAPLTLDYLNPDLLSAGRERLVRELMDEMQAGRIFPFSLPPQ